MYARLVFPSYLNVREKVRDIARLIQDSSTGNASLNNLEFISVTDSELFPGVNSGWSLVTGSIPAAGTAIGTEDREYIFQCDCVNSSKKKYVSIASNGATSVENSNSTPLLLSPYVDYGTATQNSLLRTTSSTSTAYRKIGVGDGNGTVYVFASPRKLIIAGQNYYTTTGATFLMMHLEFEETGQTQFYNLIPQAYFYYSTAADGAQDNSFGHYTGTVGNWSNNIFAGGGFLKSLYSKELGSIVRLFQFTAAAASTDFAVLGYTENNTAAGFNSSLNAQLREQARFAPQLLMPPFARYWVDSRTYKRIGQEENYAGRTVYPLYPLYCAIDRWNTGIISFKHCNIYGSVSDIGVTGDLVRVGNSDYVVFAYPGKSSTLIKKE